MARRSTPYYTRMGVPVGRLVDDDPGEIADPMALPGMVVVDVYTSQLYGVDSAGEAVFLGLWLPSSMAELWSAESVEGA